MSSIVTKVEVRKFENGNVMGFANITLNDDFVITGISIINGKNGLFVAFPNRKGKDGNYYDLVFPVSAECRAHITESVITSYEKMIKGKKDTLTVEYSVK